MKNLEFDVINESVPGDKFSQLFQKGWPAYRAWYLDEGEEARPSYLECVSALEKHMPELVPLYHQIIKLLDCDDLQARFLSLYCPPTFYSACSQLIYKKEQSVLIRNYDFPAFLCEGTILSSQWIDKKIIAMTDCVWGALDGINDAGLVVSINYGGRLIEGSGFGITIVVRYVLETCSTVDEAIAVFNRVPVHLDYNIALLDKTGKHATVFIAPDQAPHVTPQTTSTNHQAHIKDGKPLFLADSTTRLDTLNWLVANNDYSLSDTITQFLHPPLYRQHGDQQSGTLYTAVYNPTQGYVNYVWPHQNLYLTFDHFPEQSIDIHYA
ncbi:C45 family autoproteolytic acyltransferase/hydolase [Neptunomonas qingdaonensis]|uniref:Predicted choloylglycine hydrolase n=1 Tax=Neptunomonas qingdaonensis TaxID=1045558 RepID=A0A1I2LVS3_9GAMM|nr:C45 family peptidase [Neptunomonas qingdaonensis]SFF81081.1 Predicted choloylglycine hydrolase [Neptunomonas qingdaonensis]